MSIVQVQSWIPSPSNCEYLPPRSCFWLGLLMALHVASGFFSFQWFIFNLNKSQVEISLIVYLSEFINFLGIYKSNLLVLVINLGLSVSPSTKIVTLHSTYYTISENGPQRLFTADLLLCLDTCLGCISDLKCLGFSCLIKKVHIYLVPC